LIRAPLPAAAESETGEREGGSVDKGEGEAGTRAECAGDAGCGATPRGQRLVTHVSAQPPRRQVQPPFLSAPRPRAPRLQGHCAAPLALVPCPVESPALSFLISLSLKFPLAINPLYPDFCSPIFHFRPPLIFSVSVFCSFLSSCLLLRVIPSIFLFHNVTSPPPYPLALCSSHSLSRLIFSVKCLFPSHFSPPCPSALPFLACLQTLICFHSSCSRLCLSAFFSDALPPLRASCFPSLPLVSFNFPLPAPLLYPLLS
jgi:hypothetical protein